MKGKAEFGVTDKERNKLPKMEKEEEDTPFEVFIKSGKETR